MDPMMGIRAFKKKTLYVDHNSCNCIIITEAIIIASV